MALGDTAAAKACHSAASDKLGRDMVAGTIAFSERHPLCGEHVCSPLPDRTCQQRAMLARQQELTKTLWHARSWVAADFQRVYDTELAACQGRSASSDQGESPERAVPVPAPTPAVAPTLAEKADRCREAGMDYAASYDSCRLRVLPPAAPAPAPIPAPAPTPAAPAAAATPLPPPGYPAFCPWPMRAGWRCTTQGPMPVVRPLAPRPAAGSGMAVWPRHGEARRARPDVRRAESDRGGGDR
jgi:hypothetical protein